MDGCKGKVTLIPMAGLCNRMRAIASAQALCQTINATLHVVWIQDKGLASNFSTLFAPTTAFQITELPPRSHWWTKLRTLTLFESNYIPVQILRRRRFDVILEVLDTDYVNNASIVATWQGQNLLISSYAKFYTLDALSFDAFQPHPALATAINTFATHFDEHTVGVHIRRSDHRKSIQLSPTDRFIGILEKRIHQNSQFNFFLATDCPQTETSLLAKFGDRCHIRPKEFTRATATGMQSAVVDLYLLAKTNEVIGSYGSSFSHTAADLGGIPETTVTTTVS